MLSCMVCSCLHSTFCSWPTCRLDMYRTCSACGVYAMQWVQCMRATPQGFPPLFCAGHYVPSLSHYIAFLDRLADLGVDLLQAGSRKQ